MSKHVIDTLREQRNGRLVDELDKKLRKLVTAVGATGKVGSISLTLKVKPRAGTEGQVLDVEDAVKLSVPEHNKPATTFFRKEGVLTRDDPDQHSFEGLTVINPDEGKETNQA